VERLRIVQVRPAGTADAVQLLRILGAGPGRAAYAAVEGLRVFRAGSSGAATAIKALGVLRARRTRTTSAPTSIDVLGVVRGGVATAIEGLRIVNVRNALRMARTPAYRTVVGQRPVLLRDLRELTAGVPAATRLTAIFAWNAAGLTALRWRRNR
jgi:hypothetical protein